MKPTVVALAVALVALVIAVSAYGVYNLYSSSSSSPSPAPTSTPTLQPTPFPTPSLTNTPAASPTEVPTVSPSPQPTILPSQTPVSTQSPTSTPTDSFTPTPTNTPTPTATPIPTPTNTSSPTLQPSQNITFVDSTGAAVTVTTPVKRIASINMAVTEEICALGGLPLLVGRDDGSVLPPSVLTVPVVASSSNAPNVELLLSQEPELVIADTMLSTKPDLLQKIKDAYIPVLIVNPGNFSQTLDFIKFLGVMLNNQTAANNMVATLTHYNDLVVSRLANLTDQQRPKVYIELSSAWRTFSGTSIRNEMMVKAGGINIAANLTGSTLTPEYIATANPDIILRMVSSDTKDISDFQPVQAEIISRLQISKTNAVTHGEVYVYDSSIGGGLQYPVGLLYWAKWFHPDLFTDIDPAAVNQELFLQFLGIRVEGVFAYP